MGFGPRETRLEIQKLLEQEVFSHFLNDSCNYRLCFLLSDNFMEFYENET